MKLKRFHCSMCRAAVYLRGGNESSVCDRCKPAWLDTLYVSSARKKRVGAERAHNAVGYARRHGALPDPKTMPCADCGGAAIEYDHRDYNRPLDVEPVCRRCNLRRGSAIPLRAA